MKFKILMGCLVVFLLSTQCSFAQVDSVQVQKAQRQVEKDSKKMDKIQNDVDKRNRKADKAARKLDKVEKKKERQSRKLNRQEKNLEKLKEGSGSAHLNAPLPVAATRLKSFKFNSYTA